MTPSTKICLKAKDIAKEVIRKHKDKTGHTENSLKKVCIEALPQNEVEIAEERNLVDLSYAGLNNQLIHLLQEIYPNYNIINSGMFYYPETGYMGWHTNSNAPCKRVYIVYSDGNSFFRYIKDDKVITEWDKPGVSIKEFDIKDGEEKLWHCIYSFGDRVSIGFRLYDSSND